MRISDHKGTSVSDSAEVAALLRNLLERESEIDRDREHFWTVGLNTKNRIKYIELVSLGSLTAAFIHPRETYRLAVHEGVASIIVGHNHPSGETTPSREDFLITEKLKEAGDILGIKLLDHVIIGNDTEDYHSFASQGRI
jgi:DNA repair protein RadC